MRGDRKKDIKQSFGIAPPASKNDVFGEAVLEFALPLLKANSGRVSKQVVMVPHWSGRSRLTAEVSYVTQTSSNGGASNGTDG